MILNAFILSFARTTYPSSPTRRTEGVLSSVAFLAMIFVYWASPNSLDY